MIITCPNCQSRYKFDEARLADPHLRYLARIVTGHIACKNLAAADQKINDVIAAADGGVNRPSA